MALGILRDLLAGSVADRTPPDPSVGSALEIRRDLWEGSAADRIPLDPLAGSDAAMAPGCCVDHLSIDTAGRPSDDTRPRADVAGEAGN